MLRVLSELCGGPEGARTMRSCLNQHATPPAAVGAPSYPHHTFVGVLVAMNYMAFSFPRSILLGWLKACFTVQCKVLGYVLLPPTLKPKQKF